MVLAGALHVVKFFNVGRKQGCPTTGPRADTRVAPFVGFVHRADDSYVTHVAASVAEFRGHLVDLHGRLLRCETKPMTKPVWYITTVTFATIQKTY